jgi:hypothetical protein
MTRTQALEIAKANRIARMAGDSHLGLSAEAEQVHNAKFGYLHGWYTVGEYHFNDDDIFGGRCEQFHGSD